MSVLIQLCHSYLNSRQKPVLQPGLKVCENLREYLQAAGNLRSSSEAIGKSLVIIGRYRKIFGNLGYVKTKISRIGLKKSWQVNTDWASNDTMSDNLSLYKYEQTGGPSIQTGYLDNLDNSSSSK